MSKKKQNLLRDDIEYSVHCEENGKVIGPISKLHAHQNGARGAICHYSTWSMVFNILTGKYGIQLKNPKKYDEHSAGKWDMGVAGHNQYVKYRGSYRYLDFEENLIKEAEEEIGIKLIMDKTVKDFLRKARGADNQARGLIFDKFHYKTKINNEYAGLGFILVKSDKLKFIDNEVVDFKWLAPNELKKFLKKNDNYCDALPLAFKKAEKFRKKYLT